jgi:hypothetical protein
MSKVVKNIGAINFTVSGQQNTANSDDWQGDAGTVRVVLEGIDYVWGPNDSKTLTDNLADEAVAANGRLRIADTRDGTNRGQAVT